jgi:hypothetical protein
MKQQSPSHLLINKSYDLIAVIFGIGKSLFDLKTVGCFLLVRLCGFYPSTTSKITTLLPIEANIPE